MAEPCQFCNGDIDHKGTCPLDISIYADASEWAMSPDKHRVQVIVDAPVERTCLGRVHIHTAPDMTPEPTANQIRHRLEMRGTRLTIRAVLDAREGLMAEWRTELGPPVEVPAVFLPDDGHWPTGGTVTILLHTPAAPDSERARWRPYSTKRGEGS